MDSFLRFTIPNFPKLLSLVPSNTNARPLGLRLLFLALGLVLSTGASAQGIIKGQVQDAEGAAVPFANVALYLAEDASLIKVETTDDAGIFQMTQVAAGEYDLVVTYLGMPDLRKEGIVMEGDGLMDFGVLTMDPAGIELETATVTATRALVEIKPDRTVFNVQGTINAVGENGLDLLRKAPGVTIDNNDNINVLSRSGVLVYVDGKRLPLAGEDLANYLRNLTAEQIDRIDIITNPSARYEAEGNAGIIDIRLKKNENEGANGTVSGTFSQGRYARFNTNFTGNYRNKVMNAFANLTYAQGESWNTFEFNSFQNGLFLDEETLVRGNDRNPSYRAGVDFFLSDKHTLGFLVGGGYQDNESRSTNDIDLYSVTNGVINAEADSLLRAATFGISDRSQNTFNLNYRYAIGEGKTLNVDLDYGRFRNDNIRDQPNAYLSPDGSTVVSQIDNFFDTPIDIDISTAKVDYEQPLLGGQFSTGIKLSQVGTDNTFLFYDVDAAGNRVLNDARSNQFDYDERVYAAYLSFAGKINDQISFSAGLRSELTDATGDLRAFRVDLEEPPVELNYLSFFPSVGITYAVNQRKGNTIALNYGRRINRPDYNVLNPFRNQISQLSYEKGNPFLNPEIVDNIELGYTLAYRYNFKLAFSRTSNQITRLIGPDDIDPRAGFIGWDNLATQTNYSFNAALPFTITKNWNAFFNVSAGYLDNQADYGDGAVIDLQAFTYSLFSQHTFQLPGQFTGEISGFYSGPGIWGGVFEYEALGSLNLGLQKKFINDQMNVKLSASDILFTSNWQGGSDFNGLLSTGRGFRDSRRATLSISYNFGNQKVKSRKRNTGLEDEASRVGSK
jgi:iron complex outermembrane receptor protein